MVTNHYIAKRLVESRIDDLRRAAGGAPAARPSTDDTLRRPDARVVPLNFRRRFARPKRTLAQASEPCT